MRPSESIGTLINLCAAGFFRFQGVTVSLCASMGIHRNRRRYLCVSASGAVEGPLGRAGEGDGDSRRKAAEIRRLPGTPALGPRSQVPAFAHNNQCVCVVVAAGVLEW